MPGGLAVDRRRHSVEWVSEERLGRGGDRGQSGHASHHKSTMACRTLVGALVEA